MSPTHDPNFLVQSPVSAARSRGGSACSPYGFQHRTGASRLAYTGQRFDAVTGCYHLGNGYRAYSPALMRFHAPDSLSPFGEGGLNAYAYCGGEPVNRVDPNGHFADIAGLALRVLGMASNLATIAYNLLGPSATSRLGLNASRLSTAGSLLSLGSSAAQAAGIQSAVFGANVGTGVSLVATSVRAINAAVGPGTSPWKQIKQNWGLMTGGLPEAPPAVEQTLEMVITVPRDAEINPVAFDVNGIGYQQRIENSRLSERGARAGSAPPGVSIRRR